MNRKKTTTTTTTAKKPKKKHICEDHLPKAFSIFQETFTTIFEDTFPLKEFLIKYKNRASYQTKGLKCQ